MIILSWQFLVATACVAVGSLYIRDPLRDVPGPWLARWTNLWYVWQLLRGDFEKTNQQLHDKYGPVVRYGPNRYSIRDSTALKTIYGPGGSQFPKSSWYASWSNPGSWSLFADQDIRRHARGRSLLQSTYSMSALVHYEPFVEKGAEIFEQRLLEAAERGKPIDMRHWFQCYAFDIIGYITYGSRFGFLDRGEDVESLMHILDGHLSYATVVGVFPRLHPFLFALRNWWAGKKGSGRGYLARFTLERLSEHDKELEARESSYSQDETAAQAFLSKFLAKNAEDPERFTHEHVVASCISNIVAGSDTTAISLSAILYYILRQPECLSKLRAEINTVQKERPPSEQPFTFKETQAMPYLQAVIKEALRMHPATGLPLERVTPDGGTEIAGQVFPGGTIVGVNSWVEHRNTAVFGEDVHCFRPDRWLIDDTEALAQMNRSFMPFGLGSRTCIGRHISMLEMTRLIPRLISKFDFHLMRLQSQDRATDSRWATSNAWFVKPCDFYVTVQCREVVN